MSHSTEPDSTGETRIIEGYILDVRIVECPSSDGESCCYRFEAPLHTEVTFEDLDRARLYADVYFDVNGFKEEGTGEHGVPPEIIQGGTDTLSAYLLTRPSIDINWVSSFFGVEREKAERYVSGVRQRAAEIRDGAADRDIS